MSIVDKVGSLFKKHSDITKNRDGIRSEIKKELGGLDDALSIAIACLKGIISDKDPIIRNSAYNLISFILTDVIFTNEEFEVFTKTPKEFSKKIKSLENLSIFLAKRLSDFQCVGAIISALFIALTNFNEKHERLLEPSKNSTSFKKNIKISEKVMKDILSNIFEEVSAQIIANSDRETLFKGIRYIISTHSSILQKDATFLTNLLNNFDGERDPVCLYLIFDIMMKVANIIPDVIDKMAESVFDAFACYFPVEYNPSKSDKRGVTRLMLQVGLKDCLTLRKSFEKYIYQFFIDKLSYYSKKKEIIEHIYFVLEKFGLSPIFLMNLNEIWVVLHTELLKQSSSIIKNVENERTVIVAITKICRIVSNELVKVEQSKKNISPLLKTGNAFMTSPKPNFDFVAKLFTAIAASSQWNCVMLCDEMFPKLIENIEKSKNKHGTTGFKMIINRLLTAIFLLDMEDPNMKKRNVFLKCKKYVEKFFEIVMGTQCSSCNCGERLIRIDSIYKLYLLLKLENVKKLFFASLLGDKQDENEKALNLLHWTISNAKGGATIVEVDFIMPLMEAVGGTKGDAKMFNKILYILEQLGSKHDVIRSNLFTFVSELLLKCLKSGAIYTCESMAFLSITKEISSGIVCSMNVFTNILLSVVKAIQVNKKVNDLIKSDFVVILRNIYVGIKEHEEKNEIIQKYFISPIMENQMHKVKEKVNPFSTQHFFILRLFSNILSKKSNIPIALKVVECIFNRYFELDILEDKHFEKMAVITLCECMKHLMEGNMKDEDVESFLEKSIPKVLYVLSSNNVTKKDIFGKKKSISLLTFMFMAIFTHKGLKKRSIYLKKINGVLYNLLQSTTHGEQACECFCVIIDEMNARKEEKVVKEKEEFLKDLMSKLVENAKKNNINSTFLSIICKVMKNVSNKYLLSEMDTLLPLLLTILKNKANVFDHSKSDIKGILNCINGIMTMIIGGSSSEMDEKLGDIITIMSKYVHFKGALNVRENSLLCIAEIAKFPFDEIEKFKENVVKLCEPCLNDLKRVVRSAARKCRNDWFMIKEERFF